MMEPATIWVIGAALGLGAFGLIVMLLANHQAKKQK